jgi:hypothetical protein
MKKIFLLFLFSIPLLYSKELIEAENEKEQEPIFAGTYLSTSPVNTPPGHLLFQPYLSVINQYGSYDSHWRVDHSMRNFKTQLVLQVETGITSWLDITLFTSGSYTSFHQRKSYLYGDMQVQLGFQLLENSTSSLIPDIRLLLQESFPTGKYQHLNPKKNEADVSGSGAYETSIIFVIRDIFYFIPKHPLSVNLTLQYDFPSSVHVKGNNLYKGNFETNGNVIPGEQFIGNLGLELSLTIKLILGLDIHYQHRNKSREKHSIHSPTGLPSSEQFSLAPCIEYNFSTRLGIQAISWFTLAGRNSPSFISTVATVSCYF